jgi:hypothetical protein
LLVAMQLGQRRVAFTGTVKFADVAKVICSPKAAAPGGSACPTEIVNAARFRVQTGQGRGSPAVAAGASGYSASTVFDGTRGPGQQFLEAGSFAVAGRSRWC